jgi:hypothetical protein
LVDPTALALMSNVELQARDSDTILIYAVDSLATPDGREAVERLSVDLAVSLESSPASWAIDSRTGNLRLKDHSLPDVEVAVRLLRRRVGGS